MAETDRMILCDTNILIEFYKNQSQVTRTLREIGYDNIAISVITKAELYFGALNKAELKVIGQHLSLILLLPITESTSTQFIQLMESYSLSHKLGIPDALIAATALDHGLPLYTLNKRDFRFIEGLELFAY
jgi:predicted nucleic acid-binding protein